MHEIPELDRKGLREFGLITGGIVGGLFGLFFPWLLEAALPVWPWLVCGILVAWALVAPATLAPVYKWWMRLGLLLSRITTPLILGAVFYLVILPVGLGMRLIGRDPMARCFDEIEQSYRVPTHRKSKEHMENPY